MSREDGGPVLFFDCAPWCGGGQRSFADLICALRAGGTAGVLVAGDMSEDGLLARCGGAGVPCRRGRFRHWARSPAGVAAFVWDRMRAGRLLRRVVSEVQPSLLHVNGVRAALLVPGRLAKRIPLVVHDRDLRSPQGVLGCVASRAACVVAISRCVAARWEGVAAAGRVEVVWNGFDVAGIRAEAGEAGEVAASGSGLQVALAADWLPWKGHELLLEAVARLRRSGRKVRVVLAGRAREGAGERHRRRLAVRAEALGLGDSVEWVCGRSSAIPVLASADVVVSVSEAEPFGRTVVEALALGKPVVATRGYGPEEILDSCAAGTLVARTPEGVAEGLAAWWEAERRAAVAAAARERARAFSIERMVKTLRTQVYEPLWSGLDRLRGANVST